MQLVIDFDEEQKCLRLRQKLKGTGPNDNEQNDVLGSTAQELQPNNEGRLCIPTAFLAKLDVSAGTSVILVGALDRLEIWPEALWNADGNQYLSEELNNLKF